MFRCLRLRQRDCEEEEARAPSHVDGEFESENPLADVHVDKRVGGILLAVYDLYTSQIIVELPDLFRDGHPINIHCRFFQGVTDFADLVKSVSASVPSHSMPKETYGLRIMVC